MGAKHGKGFGEDMARLKRMPLWDDYEAALIAGLTDDGPSDPVSPDGRRQRA